MFVFPGLSVDINYRWALAGAVEGVCLVPHTIAPSEYGGRIFLTDGLVKGFRQLTCGDRFSGFQIYRFIPTKHDTRLHAGVWGLYKKYDPFGEFEDSPNHIAAEHQEDNEVGINLRGPASDVAKSLCAAMEIAEKFVKDVIAAVEEN